MRGPIGWPTVSGIDVGDRFDRFLDALRQRHDFFHAVGCRLSDHGIETFYAADYTPGEIAAAFRRVRSGKTLEAGEIVAVQVGRALRIGRR